MVGFGMYMFPNSVCTMFSQGEKENNTFRRRRLKSGEGGGGDLVGNRPLKSGREASIGFPNLSPPSSEKEGRRRKISDQKTRGGIISRTNVHFLGGKTVEEKVSLIYSTCSEKKRKTNKAPPTFPLEFYYYGHFLGKQLFFLTLKFGPQSRGGGGNKKILLP